MEQAKKTSTTIYFRFYYKEEIYSYFITTITSKEKANALELVNIRGDTAPPDVADFSRKAQPQKKIRKSPGVGPKRYVGEDCLNFFKNEFGSNFSPDSYFCRFYVFASFNRF